MSFYFDGGRHQQKISAGEPDLYVLDRTVRDRTHCDMEHEVCDSVQYLEGWIDVLGNGLLKRITLKSGNTKLGKPQTGQNVSVWMKMMHENRKEVEDPQYISFIIGEGDVNEALEICVPQMEVEETSLILADVKFCYLKKECQNGDLPPGTKLLIEVKLLSFTGSHFEEKSESEQLGLINRVRKKGNDCFQSDEYQLAIFYYNYAVKMIESGFTGYSNAMKNIFLEEKVKCYSNMAACHLKTRNLKDTVSCCDIVLQHQPHHCKALFRKGKVLALERMYPLSIIFLKKALAVEPGHPEIKQEIDTVTNTWLKKKKLGGVENSESDSRVTHPPFMSTSWKWMLGVAAVALGSVVVYKWR